MGWKVVLKKPIDEVNNKEERKIPMIPISSRFLSLDTVKDALVSGVIND
jgi:hypothetical protein